MDNLLLLAAPLLGMTLGFLIGWATLGFGRLQSAVKHVRENPLTDDQWRLTFGETDNG